MSGTAWLYDFIAFIIIFGSLYLMFQVRRRTKRWLSSIPYMIILIGSSLSYYAISIMKGWEGFGLFYLGLTIFLIGVLWLFADYVYQKLRGVIELNKQRS